MGNGKSAGINGISWPCCLCTWGRSCSHAGLKMFARAYASTIDR